MMRGTWLSKDRLEKVQQLSSSGKTTLIPLSPFTCKVSLWTQGKQLGQNMFMWNVQLVHHDSDPLALLLALEINLSNISNYEFNLNF